MITSGISFDVLNIERFLRGSIILTIRPNTARTVGNKTCQKRFVERSFHLEITHYAAASMPNCDTHWATRSRSTQHDDA